MILQGVMTVTEAAKRWGLATGTVRRAIREGRLVATRSGGTWLVAHAEMVATYGEPKGGRSEQ
jgi:excisionase family DNA binding protein